MTLEEVASANLTAAGFAVGRREGRAVPRPGRRRRRRRNPGAGTPLPTGNSVDLTLRATGHKVRRLRG